VLCQTLENKFRWHAIYDLVYLYKRVNLFLTNFVGIDKTLKQCLMDLRDTDLADSESAVTQMTLYMYDLD